MHYSPRTSCRLFAAGRATVQPNPRSYTCSNFTSRFTFATDSYGCSQPGNLGYSGGTSSGIFSNEDAYHIPPNGRIPAISPFSTCLSTSCCYDRKFPFANDFCRTLIPDPIGGPAAVGFSQFPAIRYGDGYRYGGTPPNGVNEGFPPNNNPTILTTISKWPFASETDAVVDRNQISCCKYAISVGLSKDNAYAIGGRQAPFCLCGFCPRPVETITKFSFANSNDEELLGAQYCQLGTQTIQSPENAILWFQGFCKFNYASETMCSDGGALIFNPNSFIRAQYGAARGIGSETDGYLVGGPPGQQISVTPDTGIQKFPFSSFVTATFVSGLPIPPSSPNAPNLNRICANQFSGVWQN